MRFSVFAFASILATKSLAVQAESNAEELSNEVLFPQLASYINSLSEEQLEKVENYMSQVFEADDSNQDEVILAQLQSEEESDMAIVASYLAQLSGEELNQIAEHSANLNAEAFAQTMSENDMGELWESMQNHAPTFAQTFARELMEQDEDFL